ncbi:MAG: 3-deoxy-manno-octulosonate cytidylyltransferase [Alphaproteobacteria bacterium]|mgnify:CR=1 FL=1|jgi:3-deoxy-manno-octulosonate cytidylyltransferase (CMP-KDO synthetase)|nr:3-deoxy-manno-octulosonate cytidylyltransferase [Alphaproteobacteria bacterium]
MKNLSNSTPTREVPRNPVVLIPARMASTRLPDKPLADIAGLPMIVQCLRRAEEADVGPVVIACAEAEIAEAVEAAGGRAVLTDPDLPSGSDRIHAALDSFDPEGRHDAVVNLQGDLPTLDPEVVRACVRVLDDPSVDISTAVCAISEDSERTNPNVVKAVLALSDGARSGRALYFSRATVPTGPGDHFHHIGLYTYRRDALTRFVALPASPLELREKLEQLRALEAGMRIDAALVDTVPLGVDTPADLERARALLA